MRTKLFCSCFLLILPLAKVCGADSPRERWLFLGDSITQAGHYVDYIETWLLLNEEKPPEILALGLSSETVSGLSEPDHEFPRPYVHDRLDRVLERAKPDLVFACYGMNCAIYHPFSSERFKAYQEGVLKLVEKAQAEGAEVILLTPPPYAGKVKPKAPPAEGENYGYRHPPSDYNAVLQRYADWILSLDGKDGIRAFNIRPGVEAFLEQSYPIEPVHPAPFGHYLMAEAVLQQLGYDTGSSILENGVHSLEEDSDWKALYELVRQQRELYEFSMLNDIGHRNPSVLKRNKVPFDEAEERVAPIVEQIESMTRP